MDVPWVYITGDMECVNFGPHGLYASIGDKINFLRGLKKTYSSLKVVYNGETWCTDLKKYNKGEKNLFFNRKNFYIYLNKKKLVFTATT